MTGLARTTVVVPTIGRPSLRRLVACLAAQDRTVDAPVVLVDDREPGGPVLRAEDLDPQGVLDLRIVCSGGRGPAAARNLGWRHARTRWVSFLDDDVAVPPDWYDGLCRDLDAAEEQGWVGTQGRIEVPVPAGRAPTDDQRTTVGLADAWWITADLSYRRDALLSAGGFDERFRRAFREDTDLALRLGADHGTVGRGTRRTVHPVPDRPPFWASVSRQAGNADDRLMRRLHGRGWRARGRAPRGRLPRHAAITAAGALALAAAAAGRRRTAAALATGWLAGTAELAWARIRPGPRDRGEVLRMLVTSAVIPPAAVAHTAAGAVRFARSEAWRGLPGAVLFDRDGTLVHDVPYNGDPALVRPVPHAREALDRLREEGIPVAVVTNQSAIGSGRLTADQVRAVNHRLEELLGPFDGVFVCPHDRDAGCECRKPAPGLVKEACTRLGVGPDRCVVIGDIGSDVEAARAAGAHAVLVPTSLTRSAEIAAADHVAPDLVRATDELLAGRW